MNFEKYICNIIGDLIPLYCDGLCSQGSRSAVEEHTADCERCRRLLESCSAKINVSPKADIKPRKIIGRVRRRFLVTAVVSGMAVLFAVLFGMYHLTGNNFGYSLADKRFFGITEEKLIENNIDIIRESVTYTALQIDDIEFDLAEYNRLRRELFLADMLPESYSVTFDGTRGDMTGAVSFGGKMKTADYELSVYIHTRRMRAGVYLVTDIEVWWENYYPDKRLSARFDTRGSFYLTSKKISDDERQKLLITPPQLLTVQTADPPKAGKYYLDGNKNGLYIELSEDGKMSCGGQTFDEFNSFYEEKYGGSAALPYSGIFDLMMAEKNGIEVKYSAAERVCEQIGEDGKLFITESKRLLVTPPLPEVFAPKEYYEAVFPALDGYAMEFSSDGTILDKPVNSGEPMKFIRID